jgi:hypothetical protein
LTTGITYYVKGHFEGFFKTNQDLQLTSKHTIPEGSKHFIQIYRGIISDSIEITPNDFHSSMGELTFFQVNNVQINKGVKWPHPIDRIYSLVEMKLVRVRINRVSFLKGETYGVISGYVIASVSKELNSDTSENHNVLSESKWWDYREKKWWKENFGLKDVNPKSQNNLNQKDRNSQVNRKGCASLPKRVFDTLGFGPGCLSWFVRALLLIFILYLIFTFTEWGRQRICQYQNWKLTKELNERISRRSQMEKIINKTKIPISKCGGNQKFIGDNKPRTFTYTLGTQSGPVLISYNMFSVPDRIEVMFNGDLVAETKDNFDFQKYPQLIGGGFASGSNTLTFNYVFKNDELHELTIRVIPNQQVNSTEWEFNVTCP